MMMSVMGKIAGILELKRNKASLHSFAQQPRGKGGLKKIRKKAYDIKLEHGLFAGLAN